MSRRFTIFEFFSEAFNTFTVMILCITLTAFFIGEDVGTMSSLYKLGKEAIAIDTIVQMFLAAFALETVKVFWFSEKLIKHMMALWRTTGMLISVIPIIAIFSAIFGWFPLNDINAWGGFFLSFAICFLISLAIVLIKTRLENKKYREGIKRYRKEHGLEAGEDD